MKLAVRMRGRGYPDALDMTPAQLLFASRIVSEADDADFYADALAARLGRHGSDAAWKAIEKEKL